MLKKYYSLLLVPIVASCTAIQYSHDYDDMKLRITTDRPAKVQFANGRTMVNALHHAIVIGTPDPEELHNRRLACQRYQMLEERKLSQSKQIDTVVKAEPSTLQPEAIYKPANIYTVHNDEQTNITVSTPVIESVINFNKTDIAPRETVYEATIKNTSAEVPATCEKEVNVQQPAVTEVAVTNHINQPQVEQTTQVAASTCSAMDTVKNFFLKCRSKASYIALGAGIAVSGFLCIKGLSTLLL